MRVENRSERPNLQLTDLTPIYAQSILAGLPGPLRHIICGRTLQPLSKIDEMGRWPRQSCATSHVHTQTKGTAMTNGTVKFYNDQKGFGFIQPDNG